MSSTWSNNLKISLFGESHGPAIGCVLDNLPSGITLDFENINYALDRRSAKRYKNATPRKEADEFEILSGYFNNKTTGTPLACIIRNTNTRSRDYEPELLRPGHADYTAYKRYKESQDYRGGGHFSGRITAPLVLAGAICKEIINAKYPQIKIGSRILSVGEKKDREIIDWKEYLDLDLTKKHLPVLEDSFEEVIEDQIQEYRKKSNSIGGIVEGWVTGLEPGIGDPFFDSVESKLSSLLFSIPAIKGVEFGEGFNITIMSGIEANDAFIIEGEEIQTQTNHNGGINGGISNGLPIVFKCAVKPTPSIAQTQKTVNYLTKEETTINIKGRHDPSILLRVPVVIEAVTAICILDFLLGKSSKYE